MLSSIIKGFVEALLSGIKAFLDERSRENAFKEIGRLEQEASEMKASVEAKKRMEHANVNAPDRHAASDRLRDGSA